MKTNHSNECGLPSMLDMIIVLVYTIDSLFQSLCGESWQHKCRSVDLLVVVLAKLLFLLWRPASQRFFYIPLGILTADHKSDLTRWICWDGGVCIFDDGKDFLAGLLKRSNQWQMKPLVLSWQTDLILAKLKTEEAKQNRTRRR